MDNEQVGAHAINIPIGAKLGQPIAEWNAVDLVRQCWSKQHPLTQRTTDLPSIIQGDRAEQTKRFQGRSTVGIDLIAEVPHDSKASPCISDRQDALAGVP